MIVMRDMLIANEHNNLLLSKKQHINKKGNKESSSGLLYQTYTEIDLMQL